MNYKRSKIRIAEALEEIASALKSTTNSHIRVQLYGENTDGKEVLLADFFPSNDQIYSTTWIPVGSTTHIRIKTTP